MFLFYVIVFNDRTISTKKINIKVLRCPPSTNFILLNQSLRKKCQYPELFWFECEEIQTRITLNTDTFKVLFRAIR